MDETHICSPLRDHISLPSLRLDELLVVAHTTIARRLGRDGGVGLQDERLALELERRVMRLCRCLGLVFECGRGRGLGYGYWLGWRMRRCIEEVRRDARCVCMGVSVRPGVG